MDTVRGWYRSSRLLCPPKLPLPLAFASEPGRGAGGELGGGGGNRRRSRRWLLTCRVVMGAIRKSFYHQKRFHGSFFLAPLPIMFHGRSFSPTATGTRCYRSQQAITLGAPTNRWKRSNFLQMITRGNRNTAVLHSD